MNQNLNVINNHQKQTPPFPNKNQKELKESISLITNGKSNNPNIFTITFFFVTSSLSIVAIDFDRLDKTCKKKKKTITVPIAVPSSLPKEKKNVVIHDWISFSHPHPIHNKKKTKKLYPTHYTHRHW
jgi:hypothetical protein